MKRYHARRRSSRPGRQPRHVPLRPLSRALWTLSLALAGIGPAAAQSLPTGLAVVNGQAQVSLVGNRMTVTNSPQAILNWNSFSIGTGQSVYFEQANARSQVLNRVTGPDPSMILGSLGSNGKVWLLNPNGVLFGAGARVDVAGLVASNLRLDDRSWLAGQARLEGTGLRSEVVNLGDIRTTHGGVVALLGTQVRQEGSIQAPGGQIVLAGGSKVELADTGAPNVSVRLSASDGAVRNSGALWASGGRVDLYAAVVNQEGLVQAGSLATGASGEVLIRASEQLVLGAGSETRADGASGGQVWLETTAGRTSVHGTVSAEGSQGAGGGLRVLGREVGLFDGARLSASGAAGGGLVHIGGGDRGQEASLPNARALYMAPGAVVAADALQQGDGGRITLWSDQSTRVYGSLSARGGAAGGQGGWIETSGGWLDARPARIDVGSPKGRPGTWLLDPYDLTISDSVPDAGVDAGFTATGNNATLSAASIRAALDAGTNVTVSTGGAGGNQSGDLVVDGANLTTSASSPGSLTLVADRHLDIRNGAELGSSFLSPVNLTLEAGRSGAGGLTITDSYLFTGGRISLNARSVSLLGATSLYSTAQGDAIVIAGPNNSAMSQFNNAAGYAALGVSFLGRWIIYFDDPASPSLNIGGLSYDFKRVSSAHGGWSGDYGNGLVFSKVQTATFSGSIFSRSYDGTTDVPLDYGSFTAVSQNGETGSGTEGMAARYVDKNAGVGKVAYFYGWEPFEFLDSNSKPVFGYQLIGSLTGRVTPAPLTGSLSAVSRVYNGNTAVTLVVGALSGLIGSESVVVTAQGSVANKNVGTAKPVTLASGFVISDGASGGLGQNYSFSPAAGGSLVADITPRPVTLTHLQALDKVYDGTTQVGFARAPQLDAVAGDDVGLAAPLSARFGDKNVGTGKPILFGALALAGADAGNYQLQPLPEVTASITPRPLDVTGASVLSKVYDGTTVAPLSGTPVLQALPGDQVTLGGTLNARYADKNAGLGKTVLLDGVVLGGVDAGNYTLTDASALRGDILPKPVTIQGLAANHKVYDATTLATLTGQAKADFLSGDTVQISGTAAAQFADKQVGQGKAVTVTGLALQGLDAPNYVLSQPQGLKADITPREIGTAGLRAADKVYDGSTTATLSGQLLQDVLPGDVVTLAGAAVATFADKNVGNDKAVAVSGIVLGGADGGNYVMRPGTLTADITPRPLNVGGLAAQDKVYDGTTAASLAGTAAVSALPGDSLSVGGAPVATFADKNAGNGKAVSVTGLVLGGADANNYSLQGLALTASIAPRPLQVSGLSALGRAYDGTTQAALAGSPVVTALGSDQVALSGSAQGRFQDKNVGTGKPVQVDGLGLTGSDAANYLLSMPAGLRADITPRPLAVTGLAAQDKVYDGSSAASLQGQAGVAPLAGDQLSLTGTAVARFDDANTGTGKPVSVSGFGLQGPDAPNYLLSQPQGLRAAVTPALLTYVADPVVRSVGQSLQGLTGQVSGLVAGESLAAATTGALTFTTSAPQAGPPGLYPIQGGGLSARNYRFEQAGSNAQALTMIPDVTPVTSSIGWTSSGGSSSGNTSGNTSGGSGTTGQGSSGPAPGPSGVLDLSVAPDGRERTMALQIESTFRPVPLSSMGPAELGAFLAAREQYKHNLLAGAVTALERNPGLADLRECLTLQEVEQGICLVTPALKAQLAAAAPGASVSVVSPTPGPVAAAPAPSVSPAPVSPAPAAAPAAAPSAAPSASPAPAPVATALPAARAATAAIDLQWSRRKVRTATLPQIERKVALVIGVANYQDASIPELRNSVRDAKSVGQMLETKFGYETLVLEDASRASVVTALNRLALTAGPKDSVIVYYAGHGELVKATGLGYWLTADSRAQDPKSWLANTDINRLVSLIGAGQVALVSDSCFSGSLTSDERIRGSSTPPNAQSILQRRSVVVMSSGANEPVFDEGRDGHSPFAYHLMGTLSQVKDWQVGGNVFERVRFAVAKSLPQRPQYSAAPSAGHQPGGDYLFEARELETAR